MPHWLTLFNSIVLLFFASTAAADVTLIHAGQLLAVPGKDPSTNMTIIVEDGRITGVQEGFVAAEDATVIDLSDKFVLPGLMDMHVHLQGQLGPDNDRDALKMSDQLMQMRSIHYAMNTLEAGFTTVRDVGSSSQEMYALRDAINNGWIDGPRIIAAGGVGITGGHADISGVSPDLMEMMTSKKKLKKEKDQERLETELKDIVLNNLKERMDELLDSDKTFSKYLKKLVAKDIDPFEAADKITKSMVK